MASRAQNLSKLARIVLEGGTLGLTAATTTITDSSYVAIADLAVRPTGGYIKITGTGFVSGCTLYINGSPTTSTTFISATEVRAQLPALPVGTYSLMLFNSATIAAIWASGITYSSAPVWGTSSYSNAGNVISTQLLATGEAPLVYTLASGTLPTGVTLSSSGLLSGTASGITSSTTITFTVAVSDLQNQATPQLISLSLSFYIGKLYAWGRNTTGQLGDGTTVNRSSPIQVGALTNWLSISAGYSHSLAIKMDNTLWAWGTASSLGDNTTVNKSSPIQIGSLTNWKSIKTGNNHSIAIKTDGTLWTWGANSYGQLGLGNSTNTSSPIQVGLLTDWLSIATGENHTIATKINGTVWSWGRNDQGQLGDSTQTNKSSPVQIGALTDWLFVTGGRLTTAAVKTDGTLWTWGRNSYGQLGLGSTSYWSTYPRQVGALSTWKTVAMGWDSGLASKTDGTLWSWGRNYDGELGIGNKTSKYSPVQVGLLTNWNYVSMGRGYVAAIKTDNTLWAWGYNAAGQLGQGNILDKVSPVQVGSLVTWYSISTGANTILGITAG